MASSSSSSSSSSRSIIRSRRRSRSRSRSIIMTIIIIIIIIIIIMIVINYYKYVLLSARRTAVDRAAAADFELRARAAAACRGELGAAAHQAAE